MCFFFCTIDYFLIQLCEEALLPLPPQRKWHSVYVHICVNGKYDKGLARVISRTLSVIQRKLNGDTQLPHKA